MRTNTGPPPALPGIICWPGSYLPAGLLSDCPHQPFPWSLPAPLLYPFLSARLTALQVLMAAVPVNAKRRPPFHLSVCRPSRADRRGSWPGLAKGELEHRPTFIEKGSGFPPLLLTTGFPCLLMHGATSFKEPDSLLSTLKTSQERPRCCVFCPLCFCGMRGFTFQIFADLRNSAGAQKPPPSQRFSSALCRGTAALELQE